MKENTQNPSTSFHAAKLLKHCHAQTQNLPVVSLMSLPPQSPHSFPADVCHSVLCVTAVLGVLCSVLPNTATTLRASHSIISHRAPFPQFRDLCCRNAAEAELLSGYVGKFFHFCIPAMRRQNLRLPSSSRTSPLFTHHLRASQAGAEQAYVSCQSPGLTPKSRGSCQPSAHVHGSHGVPDAILIRGVIQALHGAEAGAPVVAPDDVDSVVQRHRGHVAPLAGDALGQQKATPRSKMEQHWPWRPTTGWFPLLLPLLLLCWDVAHYPRALWN